MLSLPNDVTRLILLECSLNEIRTFLIYMPKLIDDRWWKQYFYHRIPPRYHCIFEETVINQVYMRREGKKVLLKVKHHGPAFLESYLAISQINHDIVLTFRNVTVERYTQISQGNGCYQAISLSGSTSSGKCVIWRYGVEYQDGDWHFVYSKQENCAFEIDEYPYIVWNVLLTGGRSYLRKHLKHIHSIESEYITRDNLYNATKEDQDRLTRYRL